MLLPAVKEQEHSLMLFALFFFQIRARIGERQGRFLSYMEQKEQVRFDLRLIVVVLPVAVSFNFFSFVFKDSRGGSIKRHMRGFRVLQRSLRKPQRPAFTRAPANSWAVGLFSMRFVTIQGGKPGGSSSSKSQPTSTTITDKSVAVGAAAGSAPVEQVDQRGTVYYDNSPRRATGMWTVDELTDQSGKTISFRKIDEVETELHDTIDNRDNALVLVEDEEKWKHKLMFIHRFAKTPKHLTWRELGQEIECLDCVIDLDDHRPEEFFTVSFFFLNRKLGTRDVIWTCRNDVSASEGFTDLLAACGSCLGRSDVHRTIRFDDGVGTTREICLRKDSKYTSEITMAFRPPVAYDLYGQNEATLTWEKEMEAQGLSTWGFHPSMMDPEYRDEQDPVGTYHLTLSAHAFSFVMLRAIERLISRPLKDFYRPSQVVRTMRTQTTEDIGFTAAVRGWLGCDEKRFQHYTPLEAIQEHWLGNDAPFSLTAIVNKLREMCYLKPANPEYVSWLSVRQRESALAVRNIRAKLLGAGASPLFAPLSHNATVNQLLPRDQRRNLATKVSVGGLLGMPDETRRLDELKKITGVERITHSPSNESIPDANPTQIGDEAQREAPSTTAHRPPEGREEIKRTL